MKEIQPTFAISARLFWALTWRAMLILIPATFVGSYFTGIIISFFSITADSIGFTILNIFIYAFTITVYISVIQRVLGIKLGNKRFIIVEEDEATAS